VEHMRLIGVLRAALAAIGGVGIDLPALRAERFEQSRRYPEWRSFKKTRGRRDASLRSRSNRRKAAK
jgi:hypothetical protein